MVFPPRGNPYTGGIALEIGTVGQVLRPLRCAQPYARLVCVRTAQEETVALDLVGAEPGDTVLLLRGGAAVRCCMEAPADATVVAVLS